MTAILEHCHRRRQASAHLGQCKRANTNRRESPLCVAIEIVVHLRNGDAQRICYGSEIRATHAHYWVSGFRVSWYVMEDQPDHVGLSVSEGFPFFYIKETRILRSTTIKSTNRLKPDITHISTYHRSTTSPSATQASDHIPTNQLDSIHHA
jgi:hypothetical protein